MKIIMYCPGVVELDGRFYKKVDITHAIKSPATFFDIERAASFNSWWAFKRKSDGKISVKSLRSSKEELLSSVGLTGDGLAEFEVVAIKLIDGKLIEVDSKEQFYSAFSWHRADWDDNSALAIEALKSKVPDAAIALLGLMQYFSNEFDSASWSMGNEYRLWSLAIGATNSYGTRDVHHSEIEKLISLHQQCDGWWKWLEGIDKLVFVGTEQWKQHLN